MRWFLLQPYYPLYNARAVTTPAAPCTGGFVTGIGIERVRRVGYREPTEGGSKLCLGRVPIWLYLRFTLSYRDVEELLAERGLDVSYERVRRWVLKFAPMIARNLRQGRPRPSGRWHLDEMVVRIAGRRMYLWRAVDHEGEVLDILVQRRRDTQAALRLMRKLLKKLVFRPSALG
jgi:hypothetical protein